VPRAKTRAISKPMSYSPTIAPEVTGITYSSAIFDFDLSRINAARAPMNLDGELEMGITIDIPMPMVEGTIFLYLGLRSSIEGSIIPIIQPTLRPILAMGCRESKP